jgi:hypothetical protein
MKARDIQNRSSPCKTSRCRRLYLEGANADYLAMNRDPKARAEFEAEMAAWDSTNLDGLELRGSVRERKRL